MRLAKGGHVYIITNKYHTVLYTGVTSDLHRRTWQHREKYYRGSFSARYNANKLVYFAFFETIEAAIEEEKRIKAGSRAKKIWLIESMNPEWKDLWEEVKLW
ncbi:MAG: GIY-YIG nuclease family protein [Chitinophagaceae bacterium]|nr:GIY-YIG nuclease family protein [Chitinophagaceae bacterium]